MTTKNRPRPMTTDVSKLISNEVEALFGKWQRRGYCPCCVARDLLFHTGELAVMTEVTNSDLHQVLDHISEMSEQHRPLPSDTVRH